MWEEIARAERPEWTPTERDAYWTVAAGRWLQAMAAELPSSYRIHQSADFLLLSALEDRPVEVFMQFCQSLRRRIARNLLDTLRRRELDTAVKELSAEIGLPHAPSNAGEYVVGLVRQRLTLASGRFAMIDDGLGFQLVPWSHSLDRQIGKHISGVMRGDGGVDWSYGRGRALGL